MKYHRLPTPFLGVYGLKNIINYGYEFWKSFGGFFPHILHHENRDYKGQNQSYPKNKYSIMSKCYAEG